jgi:2-polyprenyl-6-methoxyphenol hydroxylase-like FAD-dependent oxidoreductase
MAFEAEVIVVGAGPSGCLLTLRLIRQGIRVALIEQEVEIQPHFRALGYPGCTHAALEKAGIWEDVKGKGFIKRGFSWRRLPRDDVMGGSEKIWGDLIATWDPYINSPLRDGDVGHGMLALPQNRFREIIMPKILASDLAAVFLGHTAVELRQNSTSATVTVVNSVGSVTEITGAFLVGADGGKSVIRKQLGLHLNGFTWNQIVVAVDMLINLPPPKDGPSSLYYVDPVDFAFFSVIEKPSGPGPILWRCTLVIREEESHPDMFDKTLKQKLDKLTPGPRPLKYQLLRAQQYRIHQRSSETMKKGRCLLVGDAAHLTNVRLIYPLPVIRSMEALLT